MLNSTEHTSSVCIFICHRSLMAYFVAVAQWQRKFDGEKGGNGVDNDW